MLTVRRPLENNLQTLFTSAGLCRLTPASFHVVHVAGPGISSYASTPWKAGESLTVCMQEAMQKVPRSRHQDTPLYLGATAGMRLLKYRTPGHTHTDMCIM